MEIILLSRYFHPGNTGGVGIGRVSQEMLIRLSEKGHSTYPIFSPEGGLLTYFLYTSLLVPLELSGLRKSDIYHALTPMESLWIPKKKSVVTFHDLFLLTNSDFTGSGLGEKGKGLGRAYFQFACKQATKCKKIVCTSSKTANEVNLLLKVPAGGINIIHWGIKEDLQPSPRQDMKPRFGYLGMLDNRKRVDKVIEAYRASGPKDSELVIVGKGLEGLKLSRLANGDPRITFYGFIKDERVPTFYNSLDYFLFPTSLEGYGLPIVEAMACKKPVVVLEDASIPLEVKSRCLQVKSYKAFFEEVCGERPIQGPDIEDNFRFAQEHNWDTVIKNYLKLYEEVLNG